MRDRGLTYLYKVDEVGEKVLGVGREPDLDLSQGSDALNVWLNALTKDHVEGGMNSVTG
jgi:hypothetical protein